MKHGEFALGKFVMWTFILSTIILYVIFGGLLGAGWMATFFLTLMLFYLVASWRFEKPIGPDEIGVRLFFGKPLDRVYSGPAFAPRGIVEVMPLPIKFTQYELPGEPEDIFRDEDKDDVPKGKKPPVRITFREDLPAEKLEAAFGKRDLRALNLLRVTREQRKAFLAKRDESEKIDRALSDTWTHWRRDELEELEEFVLENYPDSDAVIEFKPDTTADGLSRRTTQEIVFIIAWMVDADDAINFVRRIGSTKEANRQMEDELISVAVRLLSKISLAQALQNFDWLNAHLYTSLIKRVAGWGIRIDRAFAKKYNLNHALNEAIAEANQAEFRGRADKELLIQRGHGEAEAERAKEEQLLIGRAEGLKIMAESVGISGSEAMAAEVAREIGQGGNTIVLGTDGMTQLMAANFLRKEGGAKKELEGN